MRNIVRAAVAGMLLTGALPAHADILSFTGHVTGLSYFLGTGGGCGGSTPYNSAIDPLSTKGTSSLGAFHLSTDTCLSNGGGISMGSFIIAFGSDEFSGTFDGGSTPTDVTGVSDTAWLFTILDGTGRFEGASGTFDATGIADARTRPTHVSIDFAGDIDAPAVPEPATWALMILGFGGMGVAMRRRRQRVLEQLA